VRHEVLLHFGPGRAEVALVAISEALEQVIQRGGEPRMFAAQTLPGVYVDDRHRLALPAEGMHALGRLCPCATAVPASQFLRAQHSRRSPFGNALRDELDALEAVLARTVKRAAPS